MTDTTRNLIDLAADRLARAFFPAETRTVQRNRKRAARAVLVAVVGARFDELESLNLALLNRAGVQSEILTALAERRTA